MKLTISVPGTCKKTAKCVKKDGHKGKCWPST